MRPVAGDLVRELATRYGDRSLAVLGDQRLTYADAERCSAALAKGLLASRAGKGSRVGLLAPNSPDWIVCWLAASRIGAVVALLNTYSPPRELAWALRHSDTAVLLTVTGHLGQDYLDRLERAVGGLAGQHHQRIRVPSHPYLRAVWALGAGAGGGEARPARPWSGTVGELVALGEGPEGIDEDLLRAVEAEVSPADPMVLIYSSGSTAEPKGAIHTQGAVVRHGRNLLRFRGLDPGDRIYTPMPFFWVGGLSYALVRAMHAGATLVLEERFEPGATLELLERERVTHILAWPHIAPALVGHPDFGRRDLSSLRGAPVPELLPEPARPEDPGLQATSLGMTETLGPHLVDHEGRVLPEEQRGSFGRPVPGLEHRVVDAQGRELPPGEPGELWVRGYSVMAGLHKREREEVFTADGWYRTGDGGWFDAGGHFHFTGRIDDLIKARGRNVSPREVEEALAAEPEVTRAVVVGIPSGDGGEELAAAVVAAGTAGAAELVPELQQRLRERLSAYKVPRHVAVLGADEELPWLDSGKVDRRGVARLLAERFGPAGAG
jgi:acyl-CoA synthetase (AMP-forming)/AMP-acid ligase II